MRLYDMTKDAVTGAYHYVKEKLTSRTLGTIVVAGSLVLAGEAQAAFACSNTAATGICTIMTASGIFTEMKDIATWIALGFIVFGFILFAGFKIYGVSKKS